MKTTRVLLAALALALAAACTDITGPSATSTGQTPQTEARGQNGSGN
jgi:hypothetical protein